VKNLEESITAYVIGLAFFGLIGFLEFASDKGNNRKIIGVAQVSLCIMAVLLFFFGSANVKSGLQGVNHYSISGGPWMNPAAQVDGSFLLLTALCNVEVIGAVLFMKRIGPDYLFGAIFVVGICMFAWAVAGLNDNVFGPRSPLLEPGIGGEVKTGVLLIGFAVALAGLSVGLNFYKLYYVKKDADEKIKKR
jgi:hypothetical protein